MEVNTPKTRCLRPHEPLYCSQRTEIRRASRPDSPDSGEHRSTVDRRDGHDTGSLEFSPTTAPRHQKQGACQLRNSRTHAPKALLRASPRTSRTSRRTALPCPKGNEFMAKTAEQITRRTSGLAAAARPVITGASHALPAQRTSQADLWSDFFHEHYQGMPLARRIFENAGISTRSTAVDPRTEKSVAGWSTGQRMERYIEEAMPLGKRAV